MTPDVAATLDATRAVANQVCADLPGQLLLIPFFGLIASPIAAAICGVINSILSLPNDVLLTFMQH